jgi:hypothetical protein
MSWQKSVARAATALRQEEARLAQELALVRKRLEALGGVSTRGSEALRKRRNMSEEARAAISRAAKRRWAKYRAEKRAKS